MDGALRLLKFRDRSVAEMASRLAEKGFAPPAVERTIARLREVNLLNDESLARRLAEARRRGGRGDRLVRRDMEERGLPADAVERALAEPDPETERERLDCLARKLAKTVKGLPAAVARRRLYGRLARRGFSAEDIHAALRPLFSIYPREDA